MIQTVHVVVVHSVGLFSRNESGRLSTYVFENYRDAKAFAEARVARTELFAVPVVTGR